MRGICVAPIGFARQLRPRPVADLLIGAGLTLAKRRFLDTLSEKRGFSHRFVIVFS